MTYGYYIFIYILLSSIGITAKAHNLVAEIIPLGHIVS